MNENFFKKNDRENSFSCPNPDCDQQETFFINNMRYSASLHCLIHCKSNAVKEEFLKDIAVRTCRKDFKNTTILVNEGKSI